MSKKKLNKSLTIRRTPFIDNLLNSDNISNKVKKSIVNFIDTTQNITIELIKSQSILVPITIDCSPLLSLENPYPCYHLKSNLRDQSPSVHNPERYKSYILSYLNF